MGEKQQTAKKPKEENARTAVEEAFPHCLKKIRGGGTRRKGVEFFSEHRQGRGSKNSPKPYASRDVTDADKKERRGGVGELRC